MKQLLLLALAGVLICSSCTDRVYSYRKKGKVDPQNGPIAKATNDDAQVSGKEDRVEAPGETTGEPVLASAAKEPVLINYMASPTKTSEVKTPSVNLSKQFKAKRTEMKRAYREYKRAYVNNGDKLPFGSTERTLIIVGLIFLLMGVILGVVSGTAGWLLVTIGAVLIVVGLILWLITYV